MIKGCTDKKDLVLLSSFHNVADNKLFLKMYNPKTETLDVLETADGFLPYTYFKMTDENFDHNIFQEFIKTNKTKFEVQITEMDDLIEDTLEHVIKLYSSNVFNVYEKLSGKLGDVQQYENRIKYHESYIFEKQLIFSSNYDLKNKTLYGQVASLNEIQKESLQTIKHKIANDSFISLLFSDKETTKTVQYLRYLDSYTNLLSQEIPDFKRVAIDIEVL